MADKVLSAMPYSEEYLISDILVKPKVLQITASELIQRAKRIKSALAAVDHIMIQLDASQFEGRRASTLLARYRKMRDTVMGWTGTIDRFSRDLDLTSTLFEQADRSG